MALLGPGLFYTQASGEVEGKGEVVRKIKTNKHLQEQNLYYMFVIIAAMAIEN